MLNFEFYAPARILFGKGTEAQIGELLKPHASKVLLHYGGGSIKKSGLYDTVTASLQKSGVAFAELGGVRPNPRLALVKEGIALCKKENVDLILAVGGGSAIDSAKAIAMGVCYGGDVWDVYDQNIEIEKALPVAVILTIPAAGSESSGDTVITNEEKQLKYGYGSPRLRPLLSIINPELFFTLPKEQLANGVADMMSHVFERYFTNTTHTDLTDGLCEATLKTLMKNAPLACRNMRDYDAWSELGFGGTVAHNGLVGMGREQDWACHNMEHELSAIYDVAHGAGLAVLTPGWMRYVYKDNVNMFVQFAVNVMGVEGGYRDPDAVILEGIDRLQAFFGKLGLTSTLSGLGIGEDRLEEMAKKATGAAFDDEQPLGGLKKLYWRDVLEIYKMVK
ncbi:MAG: iron-containing alcohol dehydrogenase [Oscillospiraceae bacterium]|jgi:alcohol dehydrogenase YqhD (iron-dependent ADH family)|nr:iron-containing alcohol dehydrogenase [Oscillospiraceae bacterium]